MKLDTEYELNEPLWYLRHGKVYAVKVTTIEMKLGGNGTKNSDVITWSATISYLNPEHQHGNMTTRPLKKDLFRTKEEAGKELLKRAGFDCGLIEIKE